MISEPFSFPQEIPCCTKVWMVPERGEWAECKKRDGYPEDGVSVFLCRGAVRKAAKADILDMLWKTGGRL